MMVLGIDPGKDGYLAALDDGVLYATWPMPTIRTGKGNRRDYDVGKMAAIVDDLRPGLVVLEKQQAMPGQGVASMFSTGVGFGLWLGILAALKIRYEVVHPRTWQRALCRDIAGEPKARALIAARRLFPGVDLRGSERSRKDHAGKVDALLIAYYGSIHHDQTDL